MQKKKKECVSRYWQIKRHILTAGRLPNPIGGNVDQKSQEKFDSFARDQLEMVLLFPPFGMVYDFQMDLTTRKLMPWQTTVPDFKYDPKVCLPLRIHNGVK